MSRAAKATIPTTGVRCRLLTRANAAGNNRSLLSVNISREVEFVAATATENMLIATPASMTYWNGPQPFIIERSAKGLLDVAKLYLVP